MKSLVSTVLPLSFYAALIIRRNGIPYNQLPPRIQKLVSRQCAKGKPKILIIILVMGCKFYIYLDFTE